MMYCIRRLQYEKTFRTGSIYYKLHVALSGDANNDDKLQNTKKARKNDGHAGHPFQALVGVMGSDLVDLRTGESREGAEDSEVEFNALILSAIKALCLLFGVVGCADKDFDLFGAIGTVSNGPAPPPPNCDNLVSMDGKPSNTGETRGRDELVFRPSS